MFTFVSGGLRSGKSNYALRRASELGAPPWLYVAPEIEGDDDLKARLARHRRDQDAIWRLKDAPEHLEHALDPELVDGHGAMVLDRFSLWLSGRLAAAPGVGDRALLDEVERLANRLYHCSIPVVLVTTEVGLGFLPAHVPDRRLVNVVGIANQILAERAGSVVFMVSGVAQRLR
ncbi:MAG: bifunctional adenosylcobinamide kinase/adenosylcobinamide-phosphate guanylyltransferase [Deltaproteobacteria bacterium]|nr:bifunctional adenosylcobinamide kinase/adenosylcobinamide-phosphate guanylyltransferase [Deltaproteobacteria bacterium]